MRTVLAIVFLLGAATAQAASFDDVAACLEANDVPCAEALLEKLNAANDSRPEVKALVARVHFYAGRYPEAYDALSEAVQLGWPDRWGDLALYERTLFTTSHWVEEDRGRFGVRFRPGIDALLVDEASRTLDLSEKHLVPLLGDAPPGKTLLEIFPTTRSFIAASSLTTEDVYTTNVVALSKWSRLLLTSPRQMPRGYDWQDTVAHEYIHLVVAHNSDNEAPVWLQESIAKYLDNRWRDGTDRFHLEVRAQGLLAEALENDTLVTFEEMHPSLAKLPTPELASLAYAQLSTLMDFCFERAGEEILLEVLPRVGKGVDPRVALAEGAGFEDFAALEAAWKSWLAGQRLDDRRLAEPPLVLEGGDDLDADPLLSSREDLARFVTLGDLLRTEVQEFEAALVEYHKAIPDDAPPSPLLSNRIAQTQLQLERPADARVALESSIRDYPEFALSHKTLGTIYEAEGRPSAALDSYRESFGLQPFDPEVHEALIRLYGAASMPDEAARHRRYLRIRDRGGEDFEREPLHTREGEFELPTYDAHFKPPPKDEFRDSWVGKPAPGFTVAGLEGSVLSLSDMRGKVLIVDFWATWCGPCRKAIPELVALHEELEDDGLVVLGITDEDRGTVERFLRKTPIPYQLGIDADGRVKARYQVSALPTVFIIDRKGRVAEVVVGGGEAAQNTIAAAVDRAL